MGGSAAIAILEGHDGTGSELAAGVGWQDPAIIQETGLCVWRSGPRPELAVKYDPTWLRGHLAIHWTGQRHVAADLTGLPRDYTRICLAGQLATTAVRNRDLGELAVAMYHSYEVQKEEGMPPLICPGLVAKYCGAGHGGYALHLFSRSVDRDAFVQGCEQALAIEPYLRSW